jgi:hypothetical protein
MGTVLQIIGSKMTDSGWDGERKANTLAFIEQRSQHYADKLGVPVDEVLTAWEDARNYSAVNYYQDANFREITGEVLLMDSADQFKEYCQGKGFVCGSCSKVTKSPYECSHCHWKSYGLFGPGKTATFIVLRPAMRGEWIFKPVVTGSK